MAAKTQKNPYRIDRSRKIESYAFSGFGNSISCGWERQLTTGRFATGRFCVPEIFHLSVRTKSITENFFYEKLRPLFVFIVINACFHLACANALYIFIRGLSILSFSFINKVLSAKGYCVYIINKIMRGSTSHSYDCAHAWAIKLNTRR